MYTMTEHETEPAPLDPFGVASVMSRSLSEWASELFAVPMVAAVTRCGRPGESFGSILAEVLVEKCGHTFGTVMDRWPDLLDAVTEDDPDALAVVEFINARGDELMAQALGLASELGTKR